MKIAVILSFIIISISSLTLASDDQLFAEKVLLTSDEINLIEIDDASFVTDENSMDRIKTIRTEKGDFEVIVLKRMGGVTDGGD